MAKVLLVEDDNNLREIYEARLQAEGYEISSAQDGEQALVVAKDFKPDLIISDVMMPKISGFEMLDILRNTAGLEHTRVIMLTALGQSEDKQRADSLGADRYLVKSQVTLEDIIKAAHDILDGDGAAPAAVAAPAAEATPTEEISVAAAPEVTETPVAEPAAAETPVAEVPVADAPVAETPVTEAPAEAPTPEPAPETPPADPAPTPEPPAPADPVASEPPVDTTATSVPVTDDAATTPTPDDQLLAEAANSLGANDDNAPLPTNDAPAAQTEAAAATEEDNGSAGSSKRVISPIDSPQTKPTLAELLALEEVKEAGSTPVVTPTPVVDAVQAMEAGPTPPTAGGVIAPSTPEASEASETPAEPEEKKSDVVNPHDISL